MFESLFHENGGHFPKPLLYFLNEEDGEFTKLCQTNRSMIHIVRKLLLGSMHQICNDTKWEDSNIWIIAS